MSHDARETQTFAVEAATPEPQEAEVPASPDAEDAPIPFDPDEGLSGNAKFEFSPDEVDFDPDEDDDGTVTLSVTAPFFVTSIRFPDEDGGMLVIDRQGTQVPAEDADRLTIEAAAQGTTLTRKQD